jgi:hypothetical protein
VVEAGYKLQRKDGYCLHALSGEIQTQTFSSRWEVVSSAMPVKLMHLEKEDGCWRREADFKGDSRAILHPGIAVAFGAEVG